MARCDECRRRVPVHRLYAEDVITEDGPETMHLCERCKFGDWWDDAYDRAYARASDAEKERM